MSTFSLDGIENIPLEAREFFKLENFPHCHAEFHCATQQCSPRRISGSIKLPGSTPFYADNDLGDGAIATIGVARGDEKPETMMPVRLTWLDWDEFDFESVR